MYGSYSHSRSPTDKAPDYVFWMERDYWKLPEAAKILCGRDPMARFTGRPRYNTSWRVIDIIDHAFQAVQDGKLAGDRSALLPVHVMVTPLDFLQWARRESFEIPDQLRQRLEDPDLSRQGATVGIVASRQPALISEKTVLTVAATLQMTHPELSFEQIACHQAMKVVGGVQDEKQQLEALKLLKEKL